jgi:hypothetical protein
MLRVYSGNDKDKQTRTRRQPRGTARPQTTTEITARSTTKLHGAKTPTTATPFPKTATETASVDSTYGMSYVPRVARRKAERSAVVEDGGCRGGGSGGKSSNRGSGGAAKGIRVGKTRICSSYPAKKEKTTADSGDDFFYTTGTRLPDNRNIGRISVSKKSCLKGARRRSRKKAVRFNSKLDIKYFIGDQSLYT